jgi:hypothetical protein
MPTRTVRDAELAFLKQMLGVTVGQIDDLRLRFYEGVLNGTVVLGAKTQILNANSLGSPMPLAQIGGNGTAAVNRATFAPFYLANQVKASSFSVYVSVLGATSTVRFGLWGALSTGLVDLNNKYFESADISAATTGYKTHTLALTLPAGGPYFVGVVFHTATASILAAKNTPQMFNGAGPGGNDMMYIDGVSGAFPTSGAALNGDYVPLLFATLAP